MDGLIIDGAHVLFEIDELTLDEPLTEIEGVHEVRNLIIYIFILMII